ncbi:MAG: anti-sigma F factor antagonist [Bacillota bacterium]
MELKTETLESVLLVRIDGEIDLAVADIIREAMDSQLDSNPQVKNIILNLTDVTYIDSSGLGVILGRYRKIYRVGGKMFVVGLRPQVRKILEISGLFNIIKECPSEKRALDMAV